MRKKEYSQSIISITLVLVIVLIAVIGFLKFYDYYIDETLYAERLNQMQEVTMQLYSGLEDVVENQWRKTFDSCRKLLDQNPKNQDDLLKFMEKQAYLEDFNSRQMHFIAVDQNGKYYTESGTQGLLPEREYLASSPEQVSFVSNSLTHDESKMFFLQRLSEAIILDDGNIQIQYFGISQDMEQLKPYFNCKAYDGNNSVYVTDSDGLKLFSSSSSGDLLKGFNVYHSLDALKYLHGSSFENARDELAKNGLAYSNAQLNGEEIYYSLYKMDNAEWILVFLVPSRYVAMNTVKLINMTTRLLMIFAVTLVLVSITIIFILMKKQQEFVLETEKKNNKILERVNEDLRTAAEEAERATKVAETASKAKTEFLANMSHDIRTPMNAIVGIVSLMEHEGDLTDKQHTYIQKIQMSSRHLLSLINDVLDMSKIESNEVVLNEEPVSLAEQVGQIESIIRPQTSERGQEFTIRVHEICHEYLLGDSVRLRQIFINLLSNAVKYTPYGGKVALDLAELPCEAADKATIRITVTDTGCGMTPEFVKHIYEPFTRSENSVTNKVQGTGLGMAITKNIVDMAGGTIEIHSEVDKGSRFDVTLTLPINRNAEKEIPADSVLLVSDDEVLNRNLNACMKEAGVTFSTVSTEEEAVSLLKKQKTDVILLAGHLRDQTLGETVSLLRKTAKDAVMIFCCDYAQREKVADVLQKSGVDGLIARPFFLSNLISAVEQVRENAPVQESRSLLHGMRFLCAEDNELNAEILEAILEMNGASCTICSDGAKIVEAFRKVQPGEYDAILMDVQMPRMNGLEASRAIRQSENPLGKEIPIIAMTANAFAEDVQACLDAGMDAHVSKPLDINMLEQALRNTGKFSGGGQLSVYRRHVKNCRQI